MGALDGWARPGASEAELRALLAGKDLLDRGPESKGVRARILCVAVPWNVSVAAA